jgi:hypothetical protein
VVDSCKQGNESLGNLNNGEAIDCLEVSSVPFRRLYFFR